MRLVHLTLLPLLALVACGGPALPPPPPPPPLAPAPARAPALALAPAPAPADPDQRLADLGTCALESGERIEQCRIGYRTFGALDAAKSNAVLFPTWFTGTTKNLADVVPDKLVDTKRFYLILVDAIGDGVSSSPSNSRTQGRLAFPRFTIRDMVESQRRLLSEHLGVERLHTVMGISMGGMQAIEWSVTHPERVGRVVPIVGTPQLTSHDLHLWTTELHALQGDVAYQNGAYEGRPRIKSVLDLHNLMLTTPAYRAEQTSREAFPAWLAAREAETTFDWNDWHRQLEAMLAHDVAKPYGSIEAAAKRVKAKGLVVVAEHDHMVSPIPARAFAKATGAKLVVLDGPCGHVAPGCEAPKLAKAVSAFLAE
ncbi:MAG: alpha/beta fold hydrolase [Labilithrix sp.]|nr:alpha/beta fold hydrolase [Labilithrix sp.]